MHTMMLTEVGLRHWIERNQRDAQSLIPELVGRLVAASTRSPRVFEFPWGDSISRPDEDGFLDAKEAHDPFVPDGTSYWEFGVESRPGYKASRDYKKRTGEIPAGERKKSTFVFVTPMYWRKKNRDNWVRRKRDLGEWADVRVIEGVALNHWLGQFPAIELFIAKKMGLVKEDLKSAELHWQELEMIGGQPPLIPALFLSILNDIIICA